jgi:hypothetical protein
LARIPAPAPEYQEFQLKVPVLTPLAGRNWILLCPFFGMLNKAIIIIIIIIVWCVHVRRFFKSHEVLRMI